MRLVGVNVLMARGSLIVAALVVMLSGCERKPKLRPGWAMVYGTVTFQGKPLPGGEVIWCTDKDGATIMRGGPIREDGTFALDAPIGLAHLAIHNVDVKKGQSGRYVEIPAKYVDVRRSGLRYEAKEGANMDVKIDLQ